VAIVSYSEMNEFLGIISGSSDEETFVGKKIHEAVEKWVSIYCRRTFESTACKERYDGTGTQFLSLKHFPVTALTKLAIGTIDVMQVCNTNAYTSASVSVSSTGITVTKDDVSNSTVLFATYTTVATVATAITALSNGWSASSLSSVYNNYKSTELVDIMGLSCIDNNWIYLSVPDKPEDDFEVYSDRGQIYYPWKFPFGSRNVFVNYVAGYSALTMPDDLKLAVKIICKYFYQKIKENTFNVSSFTISDVTMAFGTSRDVPIEARGILERYKRVNI
jgi:hypothetical protein